MANIYNPEFLGREHFIRLSRTNPEHTIQYAKSVFGLIVARKVFPKDTRKPDFESLGLAIVTRKEAKLSYLCPEARYTRTDGGKPVSETAVYEKYAIGAVSLEALVTRIREGEIAPIPRFTNSAVELISDLLQKHLIVDPVQTTAEQATV